MCKKILSFIFIFSFILNICNFPVNAAQSEVEINSSYFYNKLSETEMLIYKAILDSDGGISSEETGVINIKFPSGLEITGSSSKKVTSEKLSSAVTAALSALISDHPELYWIGGFNMSYSLSRNKLIYSIKAVTIKLNADGSWTNTAKKYNQLIDTALNFKVKGETTYQKVKYIHDTLCSMISYPDSANRTANDGTAYNALVSPNVAVCGGYAGAFKLICAVNGIECISVFGKSARGQYVFGFIQKSEPDYHQWNYVKMDDGKWYGVDLTWDDQGEGGILHEYFLSGSETPAPSFGDESFSESHIETGAIYDSGYRLSYPKISKSAYTLRGEDLKRIGDVNTDGIVSIADVKAILSFISAKRQFSEIEFLNADVNKDNRITIADAKRILQYLAGIAEL